MKRNLVKLLAFALSVVMFLTVYPKEALASDQTLYISDIRMAHAGSESAAKKELTDAGYIVYDADLNYNTKEDFVYIGYKTTTDPTEAITDIKMLKQDNGYQIYDSDAIMGAIAGEALDDAYSLMTMINVFRANYESGQSNALLAYKFMQNYSYSETQLLGDFIIDPALTANGLTDIVLYADSIMADGLYSLLAFGLTDDTSETWLSRMEKGVTYSVDDKLRGKARKVLKSVKSFQSEIYETIYASDKDEINVEEVSVMSTDYLDRISYKDGTLLDWLMKSEPTTADYYELTASLTEAELEAMRFLGISQLVTISNCTPEMIEAANKADTSEPKNTEDMGNATIIDFWAGSSKTDIDRIGLTNDTIREMTISDNGSFGTVNSGAYFALAGGAGVLTLVTILSVTMYRNYVYMNNIVQEIGSAISRLSTYSVNEAVELLRTVALEPTLQTLKGFASVPSVQAFVNMSKQAQLMVGKCTVRTLSSIGKTGTNTARAAVRTAARAMSASIILDIVLFLVVAGLVAYDIYEYYDPDYTEIPKAMLSFEENADGDTAYVHYNAVLNVNGGVEETNSFEGKAWNAMYYTTSDYMGEPIRADSFTDKKTNTAICEFGHKTAYDMNTNAYHDDSSVYIYFTRVDPDTLASIFAPPLGIGIIVGSVLIIGGAAAAIIVVKVKKKKAKASAPAI